MPLEAENIDLEDAIDAITETTTAAAAEVKQLRDKLERLEAKMGRPPAPAANDNSRELTRDFQVNVFNFD